METYRKNRLIFWILIFLIIVNISALATYFFYPQEKSIAACNDGSPAPGCSLHAELDLTNDQVMQVDGINSDYLEVASPISEEIKGIRTEVLDELAAEIPDTSKLNKLSLELSQLQAQLHRENIKHYLELKKVCNPEQVMRLSNLYRELYGCPMQGSGQGIQHRHKMGGK